MSGPSSSLRTMTTEAGPVALDAPRPSALSPSRAVDFRGCALLYRFRAVDRLPETPSPGALLLLARTRGCRAHRAAAAPRRRDDADPATRTRRARAVREGAAGGVGRDRPGRAHRRLPPEPRAGVRLLRAPSPLPRVGRVAAALPRLARRDRPDEPARLPPPTPHRRAPGEPL